MMAMMIMILRSPTQTFDTRQEVTASLKQQNTDYYTEVHQHGKKTWNKCLVHRPILRQSPQSQLILCHNLHDSRFKDRWGGMFELQWQNFAILVFLGKIYCTLFC